MKSTVHDAPDAYKSRHRLTDAIKTGTAFTPYAPPAQGHAETQAGQGRRVMIDLMIVMAALLVAALVAVVPDLKAGWG